MHFKSIDRVASILPFNILNSLWSPKVISLVYHAVGYSEELPYLDNLYSIPSPEQFEKDLDFLLQHYKPISLSELIRYKQTHELPGKGKYFFLSFDDGLKQCVEIIAPILKRKGISATFFLNNSFIDNRSFLHRFKTVLLTRELQADKTGRLKEKMQRFFEKHILPENKGIKYILDLRYPQNEFIDKLAKVLEIDLVKILGGFSPYMKKTDINFLIAEGHTIGSHSMNHPEFYLLTEEEQVEQVCNSFKQLDDMFKPKYKVFAFPFTDVGVKHSFFRKIEEKCKPELTFASSGIKKDKIPYNIHRISMDDSGLNAKNRIKTELLYYAFKWALGKNTYKRS